MHILKCFSFGVADLATALHELVLVLDREAQRLLSPTGLTYRHYVALFVIGEHPGIAARQLADALGVTEAAVSQMLPSLKSDALLRDLRVPGGGRRRPLELTDAGRDKLAQARALLGRSLDEHVADLGIDPVALSNTLDAIRRSL